MMKNHIASVLSIIVLLASCSTISTSGDCIISVNIRKSLRRIPNNAELFENISCIGIKEPAGRHVCANSRFAVSNGNFILKDSTGTGLLVFNSNGEYVAGMSHDDAIMDFNDYEDKYIDVLAGHKLYVYDSKIFKLKAIYTLPRNDVELISFSRREENVFQLSGFSSESDYFVEFYIRENECHFIPNPIPLPQDVLAESLPNSYFFKDDNSKYQSETRFFYSHSGDIWYVGIFTSPQYRWNLEGVNDGKKYHFLNAQGWSDRVYMTLVMEEKPYTMVYSTHTGKSIVFSRTKENCRFPIGVIKNKKNYYFCSADQVPDYLGDIQAQYDSAGLVMLEYTLSD